MRCEDCNRKMIIISSDKGVLIYCAHCHPGLDQAYWRGLEIKNTKEEKP